MAPDTRAFLAGLLLLGSASVTGCGAPGAGTTRIEPAYDPSTGRLQLLKYDSNGDGKVDTWSYMDGTSVIRIEIDSNHDAMLDRWEYYDAGGGIEKIGTSRGRDGSPDSWAYYAHDGSIVRIESSTHHDGKVDRTEYYQQGALVRAEEDTSGDGRIDKWETYEGKRLTSVAFDTIHRGFPDRRLVYGLDGGARVDVLGPPPVRP